MTTDDELLALAEGATEGCICPIHCDPDTIKRLIQRSKRLEDAEAWCRWLMQVRNAHEEPEWPELVAFLAERDA